MPGIPLTDARQRAAAAILLLIAVLAGYGLIDRVLIAKYRYYESNVEQLQDRLQRLKGMLATRQTLEAEIQHIREASSASAYYIERPSPTLAATELQQQVKQVVEASGGSLSSTQILPVVEEGPFWRVAIRVVMAGDTDVVQKVFHTLESARPLLFIDDVRISGRMIRVVNPNDRSDVSSRLQLTAQFDLAGYMRRGEG